MIDDLTHKAFRELIEDAVQEELSLGGDAKSVASAVMNAMRDQSVSMAQYLPTALRSAERIVGEMHAEARRVRRRPRTRIGRGIRRLLGQWWISTSAFGLILGGSLYFLSAPPAHADSTDTVFLAVLAADGFTYDHAMVAKVISNGHQVCAMLVAGVKPFDIVARLDATEPGLGRPESAQFAALANAVYCPQFGSAVTVA